MPKDAYSLALFAPAPEAELPSHSVRRAGGLPRPSRRWVQPHLYRSSPVSRAVLTGTTTKSWTLQCTARPTSEACSQ